MSELTLTTRRPQSSTVPADGLLHPAALLALATLIVNDHFLKVVAPSPLTGILSGFAGLVLFPLVLQAGSEIVFAAGSRWTGPSRRSIALACLATGIGYTAVELFPPATEAYRHGLAALQWLPSAALAVFHAESLPRLVPVLAVSDPLDLVALPVLVVPLWVGSRRAPPSFSRSHGSTQTETPSAATSRRVSRVTR